MDADNMTNLKTLMALILAMTLSGAAYAQSTTETSETTTTETEAEAENYIGVRLAHIDAEIDIDVRQVGFIAQAIVSSNAGDLMPFNLMSSAFEGVPIGVSTRSFRTQPAYRQRFW